MCRPARYNGAAIKRRTPAKTNAVPTDDAAGMPTINTRAGTVKLPPPIPVIPTASAITNPINICRGAFIGRLLIGSLGFRVNAAFELGAAPSPGARIGSRGGNCGARLAADAFVARIVEPQILDFFARRVFPNLAPGPPGERADFQQDFSAGQLVVLDDFQILARWRLFAAQAGEPEIEFFKRRKKRLDLAQVAAAAGIGAVENSKRGLLFGNGPLRRQILHVEIPFAGHAVAVSVRLSEMVAGIEKQDGNFRQALAQQIEDDHVLGLG